MDLTTTSDDGAVLCLRCTGVLTQRGAPGGGDFRKLWGEAAYSRRVVLDLSLVSSVESSGLAWLLGSTKRFGEAGGRLVLHSLPAVLREVVGILHVEPLLIVTADGNDARAKALEDVRTAEGR